MCIKDTEHRDTFNFEFWPDEHNEHEIPMRLSFDMRPNLYCCEIHRMCRAFALALGYTLETVDKYFGPESFDDIL